MTELPKGRMKNKSNSVLKIGQGQKVLKHLLCVTISLVSFNTPGRMRKV